MYSFTIVVGKMNSYVTDLFRLYDLSTDIMYTVPDFFEGPGPPVEILGRPVAPPPPSSYSTVSVLVFIVLFIYDSVS